MGVTLLKGIAQQDTNLVIGLTLCLGMFFILVNLLLELSYRFIDPRLLGKPEHIASSERRSLLDTIQNAWSSLLDLLSNNPITNLFNRRQPKSQPQPLYDIADLNHNKATEAPAASNSMRGAWLAVLRNFPLIVGGLMVAGLLAILVFGPALAPNNPFHTQGLVNIDGQLVPPPFAPNETYPWGTDALGRGILSLLLAGAQQTLTLAIRAVAARLLVGIVLGAIAGWFNGSLIDRLLVGLAEVISAFPTLLMTMILILAIGIRQGMQAFVIALCFVGWGEIMQFVRSEVISIRPKLFIESAVATGAHTLRIVSRHVLPILFSALVSIAALEMGAVLMLLGELGFISIFIGGGSRIALVWLQTIRYSDIPEWGAMLSNIRFLVRSYPWTGLYPMMAFFVAILSFNLFGEGVRRMVDEGNPLLNRIVNRYTVLLTVVAVLGYNWLSANSGAMPFYRQQANQFDGGRALYYTSILADPRMYGRALGSPGTDLASLYIAMNFENLDLQSAGERNTYFEERHRSFEQLDSEPIFIIEDGGNTPVYGKDYAAYPGRNMTVGEANSPVRFIALGDRSGARGGFRTAFPELQRSDFTGEILLTFSDREAWILANVPKDGLLVVTNNPDLIGRRFTLSGRSGGSLDMFTGEYTDDEDPSLWISESMAERILSESGNSVAGLRKLTDEIGLEDVIDVPLGTKVNIKVEGTLIEKSPVKHVIGFIPGSFGYEGCRDCLDQELIVVMVQYDNPPIGPEGIYQGANDNASAVAVMLEAIRTMQETGYQPYRSFLFVAYSGEGLDGGEPVSDPDAKKFLQVNPGFSNFNIEAIVKLRGVGGGAGNGLEISAGGSLRLAQLLERSGRLMGADFVRADEAIDISVVYADSSTFNQGGQEAPVVRLFWDGWEEHSRLPTDTLSNISEDNLEEAGRALALALMTLGRERRY